MTRISSINNFSNFTGVYCFGFNGGEVESEDALQTFQFRCYASKLARFLSLDPKSKQYPGNSPFCFAQNSVLMFIDLEGAETYYAGDGSLICDLDNGEPARVISNMETAAAIKRHPENYLPDLLYSLSTPSRLFDCSETVHKAGVDAVNAGANYCSYISLNSSNRMLKEGYATASWLLANFAAGKGPKNVVFTEDDSFTKVVNKNNQLIKEVAKDMKEALALKGDFQEQVESYFKNNDKFKGGYEFSPDHAGIGKSLQKHWEALTENPIALVIGGMSYVATAVYDNNKELTGFNVTFTNTLSKSSLMLHRATDIPATKFHTPLQNIEMKFEFFISRGELMSARPMGESKQNE